MNASSGKHITDRQTSFRLQVRGPGRKARDYLSSCRSQIGAVMLSYYIGARLFREVVVVIIIINKKNIVFNKIILYLYNSLKQTK